MSLVTYCLAAMLPDSVVVVVVGTRPRAIALAIINSWVSFAFLYVFEYGVPLGGFFGPPELRYEKRAQKNFAKDIFNS